jgi:hypothetical protein
LLKDSADRGGIRLGDDEHGEESKGS